MSKFKPCPFCGSGRVIMKDTYLGSKMVVCIDCGVGTGDYVTGEYAVDVWNTRAERTCEAKLCCDGFYRCTECGHSMLPSSNYCPNCGAKVVE